jgi:iron complex outermembrane receptor protein
MKQRIFFLSIFAFTVSILHAQHFRGDALTGTVTDKKTGKPLPGATITIPDLKLGTVADSLGHFSFTNLPAGSFLVEAHVVGYTSITRTIHMGSGASADFQLSDEAIEESPIVITGTSKAIQIVRNPVPIVAISHDFLTNNVSTNIIDAIAKVPGVNALTTGPNVSKPFIRGLGYNRILTLFDGVRQEGQQWGDEHGIEVDQNGIDRVEVIKGPASLTYGSDALAGVVNLIPTPPAPEGKMIGDVTTNYQTNNGEYGGSAMLGATKHGFEWMGRVSYKRAKNYQDPVDGRVYNTAFEEKDANLSLGLHKKWGYSHLNVSLYDDLQEIPDGSRDSATRQFTQQITDADTYRPIVSQQELNSYAITPLHQHVQHYRAYLANNFTIGGGRLAVNIGAQRSVRREFDRPQQPDTAGLFLQLNTYSYDIKYFFPEWSGWNLTAGINGMYQDNNVTKGTDFIIPNYTQFDVGPFVMLKKTFDKLDVSGGIRFDSRSFKNEGLYTVTNPITTGTYPVYGPDTVGADHPFSNYSHVFTGLSGSLGATYNFSHAFSIKGNIARGYRAPNISEISANGVHPGTNIYQIGNPNFKPEFSLQEDIGLTYMSHTVVVTFSVFNNVISNYIFNQRVLNSEGQDSVIVAGNQTYKFQQGKADLYGGELSIDIHPVKRLHFENAISTVYGLNLGIDPKLRNDSNRYLPQIPPMHGTSELRYDIESKSAHLSGGFVKVQMAYYATQNQVYLQDNTETRTPGYALFNAGFGTGITNAKGRVLFNVYVMGNNLLDKAYQDHLSRLKYFEPYPDDPRPHHGIYNMGRNIEFKIDVPLGWSI